MKRREFALLLASLGGCASSARKDTPTPANETPEISETPEKTATEAKTPTETPENTDSPKSFEDITVEYRSFNTAEYLKYRTGDGNTEKIYPEYDHFAQLSTSVINTSDSPTDWYAKSRAMMVAKGKLFHPILDFEAVEHNRQFDIGNLSGWNVNRIQGEPPTQTIEPGQSTRYYPLFDVIEGEETLHFEFRNTVVTFDPMV